MNEKQLDKLLKENLDTMIEGPVPVDIEKCWERFEQRIQEEERPKEKIKNNYKFTLAIVASLALTLMAIPALVPEQATAFKNSVFRAIITDEEGQRVVTDRINSEILEGEYNNVSFEKAQSLTVQHLLYPKHLPEQFKNITPQIDVTIYKHPHSITNFSFISNENNFIMLRQESLIGERDNRTYVPQNLDIETVNLLNDDREFLVLKNSDETYRINWIENSMQYTLISSNVKMQEIIKFLASMSN